MSLVKDDVDKGWSWLVLIAVYSGMAFVSITTFMNGVFLVALLDHYNEDLAKTTMIGALHAGLLCLLGPIVSVAMDMYSCRLCIVFGGFLLSSSYFISFFANSIDMLIFTFGIIGGIGNSFAFIPLPIMLAYYFRKWRNIVIALSQTTIGISMFIASPFIVSLLETYGLKGSFLIVSGFVSHVCVCGLICMTNSEEIKIKRSKRRAHIHGDYLDSNDKVRQFSKRLSGKFSFDLVTNIPLILFLLSTFTWNFLLSACAMHLPKYMLYRGLGNSAIVTVMTILGLCNTLGRFLAALTVGNGGLDSMTLHVGMLGVIGIITILLPLYSKYSSAGFIFAALCGFYTGGPNSLMTPIIIRIIGMERLSAAHGLLYFSCGVGVISGPPFTGILFKLRGSYEFSFMIIGFVLLIGSFLGLLSSSKIETESKNANEHDNKDEIVEEVGVNLELLQKERSLEENHVDVNGLSRNVEKI
ncbi:monocarboxylate transporter 12-like [Mercenaria mercenaria]|uniref:monocarboxylate transporter 12-like n=1 Tax=Mercenaria mercenaria TaxID=6596 RepID=UPI00234FAF22|nr:monocarboxylate transporter 12-like [Mercenaria mercenaria]